MGADAGVTARGRPSLVLRGFGFMLAAALVSSVMNACIRYVSAEIHGFEIAFFRNLFGLVVLLPVIARAGLGSLRTQKLSLHGLRGLLNAFAMLTFFYALGITPLADVAALSFTSPLFATLLAMLVLKERVDLPRWLGIAAGFAGALIILRPGLDGIGLGAGLVVLSSMAWAAALIDIKVLSRTESSLTITVYATFFLIPITAIAAAFVWEWPSPTAWALLFVIGGFGSVVQLCIANGLRLAEASQILPADFTKLVWASVLGYAVFAESPDVWTLVGGCLIFAAVASIAYREARLRRQRDTAGQGGALGSEAVQD